MEKHPLAFRQFSTYVRTGIAKNNCRVPVPNSAASVPDLGVIRCRCSSQCGQVSARCQIRHVCRPVLPGVTVSVSVSRCRCQTAAVGHRACAISGVRQPVSIVISRFTEWLSSSGRPLMGRTPGPGTLHHYTLLSHTCRHRGRGE